MEAKISYTYYADGYDEANDDEVYVEEEVHQTVDHTGSIEDLVKQICEEDFDDSIVSEEMIDRDIFEFDSGRTINQIEFDGTSYSQSDIDKIMDKLY